MSRAQTLVNKLNEFIPMSNFGDMNGADIQQQFVAKLNQFGYTNVTVDVTLDFEEGEGGGTLVTFADSDGDEVSCLFYVDIDMGPMASVISEDDNQIDIHLSMFDPPIVDIGSGDWIDLSNLSWINKSVITAILMAGDVHESLVYEADGTTSQMGALPNAPIGMVAAKTAVLMGGKKIKLPVIVQRSTQSDPYKRAFDKAKALGRKLDPKIFADKIKKVYFKVSTDPIT